LSIILITGAAGRIGTYLRRRLPNLGRRLPMTWDLETVELTEPTRAVWKAIAGPPYWAGTTIVFELAPGEDGGTVLRPPGLQ
jgi:hypothetical protein